MRVGCAGKMAEQLGNVDAILANTNSRSASLPGTQGAAQMDRDDMGK